MLHNGEILVLLGIEIANVVSRYKCFFYWVLLKFLDATPIKPIQCYQLPVVIAL